MSDNKYTSGTPDDGNPVSKSDKEPALSELISSTMESIGRKKQTEGSEFSADDEAKTIVAPKLNAPSKAVAASADKTDRSDIPEISFKKPEEKAAPVPRTEKTEKKAQDTAAGNKQNNKNSESAAVKNNKPKPQENKKPAPAKTQNGKPVSKKAPANAEKKPSPKPSEQDKKPLPKEPAKKQAAKAQDTESKAAADKGKTKFTKKQAATVAGLVASLLLVLALIVVLIFNHYYSLLDTSSVSDSINSAPMTYSDVDLSRADTVDKAAEDEKLKELSQKGEKISNKDVMNILLIGEDLRDTEMEDAAGNTDVMMIISVNTKDKTITMTSIMRDCYVSYQDANGYWYSNRINAAYWTGGVSLTQQTIENYMNVKIDRYVLVNFKVFIDIVDTLGGLDLYVSDEEANGYPGADPYGDNTRGMQNPLDEQNKYLGNKKGTDYIKKGGDLHLNGNQALAYARLRHVGNSDYERTERQRKVIAEMIKKSRELSIVDMDKLANKILPQIKTDVTKTEAAQLLVDMLDYRNYEIQEFRVPADGTFTDQIISGMDVLSVDFNANAEQFRQLVYGSIVLDEEGNEAKQTIE